MNQHPYLRAYLAGIAVPTVFLLIVMSGYCVLRYVYDFPVPVERVIVFPMAILPNLWGLWNVLFLALRQRLQIPLGLHGALLPLLIAPFGFVIAGLLHFPAVALISRVWPVAVPVALLVYYFAWKYLVGFLNRVQEIA